MTPNGYSPVRETIRGGPWRAKSGNLPLRRSRFKREGFGFYAHDRAKSERARHLRYRPSIRFTPNCSCDVRMQKRGGGPTLAATRVGLTESVGPRQRFSNDLPSPRPSTRPPTDPRTSGDRRRDAAGCGSLVFTGVFDATNGSPVQPAITILPAVPPSPPPLAEPSPTRSHPFPSRPFPSVDVISNALRSRDSLRCFAVVHMAASSCFPHQLNVQSIARVRGRDNIPERGRSPKFCYQCHLAY